MLNITNAILFSFLLTTENIPQSLAQWIFELGLSPWILVVTAVLLLVTYIPQIALWLPNLLYGVSK